MNNPFRILFVVWAVLFLSATVADAEELPLAGTGVTATLKGMMLERVREVEDGTTDLDQYRRECDGRICRYSPRPAGTVTYDTPFGRQVVVYPHE